MFVFGGGYAWAIQNPLIAALYCDIKVICVKLGFQFTCYNRKMRAPLAAKYFHDTFGFGEHSGGRYGKTEQAVWKWRKRDSVHDGSYTATPRYLS